MSEAAILAKAAALGAALPTFTMATRPQFFASWADRVALADSLRHAGKPYADAVAECDRQLGLPRTRLAIGVIPALVGDGLGWLAAAIGEVARPLAGIPLQRAGDGLIRKRIARRAAA